MKTKKRAYTIIFAMLITMILVGCKAKENKPSLEIQPNADNTISIMADNAGPSGGGGADITVSDGQQLIVDSALSEGEIQIKFYRDTAPANPNASVEEILHADETPALDITVNAAGTTEHKADPGSYTIMAAVLKPSTGAITISVK